MNSKKVWLVQSGHFKRDIDSLSKKDINGIDDIISLDYMGSAEFECGSLPRSLRRMTINKDFYKVFVFNQYKDENGNPLKAYAPQVFFKNVQSVVDRLAEHGYGLQEYCSLHNHIQRDEKEENESHFKFKDNRNFWWDIENDFFMFFEHTDKVLMLMDALRERKYEYEENIDKRALNKLYMKILAEVDEDSFVFFNTSIRDYYYDENNQIHFVEFLKNASLANVFMEAMIIAKVDKGIVVFNINGITFNIDENTKLDDIIAAGVDLVDSCICSDKIKHLITLYNDKVEKKEKQSQFAHTLKLVKDNKLQ